MPESLDKGTACSILVVLWEETVRILTTTPGSDRRTGLTPSVVTSPTLDEARKRIWVKT